MVRRLFSLRLICFLLAFTLLLATNSNAQITVGQVDTFDGGDLLGWSAGGSTPSPPTTIADAGPGGAGDFALAISTTGAPSGSGGGSNLVAFNQQQWTGDYLAAGVGSISVDLGSPNNVPLNVRVALRGPGGSLVTPDVIVPAGTGVINNFTFSLDPDDLISLGSADPNTLLASVTELRILHNPNPSDTGTDVGSPPFAATLLVDNITALPAVTVPEPSSAGILVSAGGLVMLRRRRKTEEITDLALPR